MRHPFAARRPALGVLALALLATLAWLLGAPTAPATPGAGSSAAIITGKFSDSCRDFAAHSSKDISHVVLNYADGRIVRDETVDSPHFSIDGGAGHEIVSAIVKSGTTTSEPFSCTVNNSPPVAVLEVKAPEGCITLPDGLVDCEGRVARTTWTRSFVPTLGYGIVRFLCDGVSDPSCVDVVTPCGEKDFYALCETTYTYRFTSSTDPDNDIVSWELDFGDGTSTGPQSWTTDPPTEVPHEYLIHYCPTCSRQPATLTVTDSAGQSASDAQFVHHQFPD